MRSPSGWASLLRASGAGAWSCAGNFNPLEFETLTFEDLRSFLANGKWPFEVLNVVMVAGEGTSTPSRAKTTRSGDPGACAPHFLYV
jgi:hypothetical protein